VNKELCSRRNFFKKSAYAMAGMSFFGKLTTGLSNAFAGAELPDHIIKLQGYVHDVLATKGPQGVEKSVKKYKKHVKKMQALVEGLPKSAEVSPQCSNCKHYKPIAGTDYGKCAMVGATGKPGKQVYKNGWCRIFKMKKSIVKSMAS
jgi:anaerobic selenocysteine-containing dehydrogenase